MRQRMVCIDADILSKVTGASVCNAKTPARKTPAPARSVLLATCPRFRASSRRFGVALSVCSGLGIASAPARRPVSYAYIRPPRKGPTGASRLLTAALLRREHPPVRRIGRSLRTPPGVRPQGRGMRVKVSIGFAAAVLAAALAGCGNGTVIGSTPPPSPTSSPPSVTQEIPITNLAAKPTGIAVGADSNLYVTLFNSSSITSYNLSAGTFTLFGTTSRAAGPNQITLGPDNNLWFTETNASRVATITLNTVKEFVLPAGAAPYGIVSGPGSNLYFTEPGLNALGSINTTTQIVAGPYTIPTANANPLGIIAAPDTNIWFVENGAAKIGRLNTLTNTVDREIALSGSQPTEIRVGPDGALWFTENTPGAPKIGRISTATGSLNEYALTGAAAATALAVGLDNNFYFADPVNNAIGAFNVNTLKTAEYKIPTPNAVPASITLGPDGKLYFTEELGNKIGQFSYF